ncbi:efflux RND transporter periplasmic adaptor subunit [Rhodovulum marinum]|uniref:HlyD family secretion protein n=1 Tax=Rhodovulum marinum TaxID=320662 RepID=A0A4R2Q8N9_9RHOB|nr:efflux RND transporter periplasmic adaptor subunit [Rhodovulum marinum]TCP43075.1 HlyD family secretion protein [Rhodovulum marinum]
MSERDELSAKLGLGAHRKTRPGWVKYALIVVALAAAWVFYPRGDAGGVMRYVTEPVTRGGFDVLVTATGSIEPTELVEISSELSGTIETVEVDFNDPVEIGTVLATLDTAKLQAERAVREASVGAARARIAVAAASLNEARASYLRGEELIERGVESEEVFIAQQAAYARAQAELGVAEADLALAEANLQSVSVDIEKSTIVSPVRGIVLERDADPGQIVAASLSAPILFTVAEDLAQMELQADIDEADIGLVAVGQRAQFTVEAHDTRVFPAEIAEVRFSPETTEGVVTYKAILALDNSDMALRPGMTATADIVVASVTDALLVPNAALRYAPPRVAEAAQGERSGLIGLVMPRRPGAGGGIATGKSVWVLRDGAPTEVAVVPGQTDGTVTEILQGDLGPGDRVITDQVEED